MKHIVVLYHADCSDGFGAAWSAWKKFKNKADYLPVHHQEPPPPGLKNKEIYLLDFTYFGEALEKLIRENKVTTIDHHVSAETAVKTAPQYVFNLDHSGAALAWKFFHPKKPTPYLIKYVEAGDLWRFTLPNSNMIRKVVDTKPFDMKVWDKMARYLEKPSYRKQFAIKGKAMIIFEEAEVKKLIAKAEIANFENQEIWVVNSATFRSEVGGMLSKKGPHVVLIWNYYKEKIYVSLRSNGSIDVSKLAKKYGGGGHTVAAGFTMSAKDPLPWKYLTK